MSVPAFVDALKKLIVVVHNVHAVSRVTEAAKVVYGMGFENFVVSKAIGAAAQSGVPEVHKLAYKLGKSFLFVADIQDILELIKPSRVYIITPPSYAKELFNPSEVAEALLRGETVAIVVGGSEPGLTKRELELGKVVTLDTSGDIGTIGYIATVLYLIRERLKELSGQSSAT